MDMTRISMQIKRRALAIITFTGKLYMTIYADK